MPLRPGVRSAIISSISSAALDPTRWQEMVETLAAQLGGAKLHLFGHDVAQGIDLGVRMAGHDPAWIDAYRRELAPLNPYPARATSAVLGRPIDLRHLLPEQELLRTRFYGEFMAPQENLSGGTGLVLDLDPTRVFVIGTLHPDRLRDRVDGAALAALADLGPALRTGWSLSRMAGGRLFEAAVRKTAAPVGGFLLVLDALGRALFIDAGGEAAAEDGRWFRIGGKGRVTFGDNAVQARLLQLARASALPDARLDGFTARLSASGEDAALHALPIQPEALVGWHGAFVLGLLRPCVLVAVVPVPRLGSQRERLREMGLTAAEVEVVLALVEGLGPGEIAERRSASLHTVRNQIKSAMWKCGVARQAQLVALASRL